MQLNILYPCRYAAFKQWGFETLSISASELGGYKVRTYVILEGSIDSALIYLPWSMQQVSASLTGTGVYGRLKYEAGVHRVQRVPSTEAHGRLHTSTMSVAVLPQPRDIEVVLNMNDIKMDTFKAAG